MKKNEKFLICKRVKFYAYHDEDSFFEWLKKITYITGVKGERDTINLFLAEEKINDEDFRSLIALFRRYKINTKQLEILVNDDNRKLYESCKHSFSINVYPAQSKIE